MTEHEPPLVCPSCRSFWGGWERRVNVLRRVWRCTVCTSVYPR
jgi:hypothetical protein